MYALLLKGSRVYDGSGLPSYNADVAVANGKIAEIGRRLFQPLQPLNTNTAQE